MDNKDRVITIRHALVSSDLCDSQGATQFLMSPGVARNKDRNLSASTMRAFTRLTQYIDDPIQRVKEKIRLANMYIYNNFSQIYMHGEERYGRT
jgi:hypothetical protein